MNRLMSSPLGIPSLAARSSLAVLATASLAQGCATSQPTLRTANVTERPATERLARESPAGAAAQSDRATSDRAVSEGTPSGGEGIPSGGTSTALKPTSGVVSDTAEVMRVAQRTEVAVEKDAPAVAGHPLTSVVVTQCNLLVAVYMTMPDGKLLRFDSSASVPADQLLQMAYTATRSERVEVSCNDAGAVGYEKHDPV
jgi:hypothetical protein